MHFSIEDNDLSIMIFGIKSAILLKNNLIANSNYTCLTVMLINFILNKRWKLLSKSVSKRM